MPDDMMLDLHELYVSGFVRINHARFKFGSEAGVYQLTGDNDEGKSSAIDAILSMVGGARFTPDDCIREGYHEAIMEADFGPLKVGLNVKRKDDGKLERTLTVTDADGGPYKNAATVMTAFFNGVAFDPLSFQRMKKEEKYDAVKGFVVGIDWEKENRGQEGDVQRRKDARSKRDDYEAQIAGIAVPDGTPKVRVDETRLAKELENAGNANLARQEAINRKTGLENTVASHNRDIARLKEVIAQAERDIAQSETAIVTHTAELAAIEIPEAVDASEIRLKLTEAQKTNQNVEALKRRNDIIALRDAEQAAFDAAQNSIDARKAKIAKAIENSPMPVKGLSLVAGEVYYEGHPFTNAATAIQIRVSVAIAIAQNPRLKLIIIRDGGLLGPKAIEIINQMGLDKGYKILVEKVDVSGRVGFFMEDGYLTKVDGKPAKDQSPPPSAPAKPSRGKKS